MASTESQDDISFDLPEDLGDFIVADESQFDDFDEDLEDDTLEDEPEGSDDDADDPDAEGDEGDDEEEEEEEDPADEGQDDEDGGDLGDEGDGGAASDVDEDVEYASDVLAKTGLFDFADGRPKTFDELEEVVTNARMGLYTGLRKRIGGLAGDVLDEAVRLGGKISEERVNQIVATYASAGVSETEAEGYVRDYYKDRNIGDDVIDAQVAKLKADGKLGSKVRALRSAQAEADAERQERELAQRTESIAAEFNARPWKPAYREEVERDFATGRFGQSVKAALANPRDLVTLASLFKGYDPDKGLDLSRVAEAAKAPAKRAKVSDLRTALARRPKTGRKKRDTAFADSDEEYSIA